ncbi:PREDICTED: sphingosine kinase 1 isoform X1 [Nanorana parkeri]|uniref:sphingosine kinase 1 isoform X1 n=1 Tax=Nanorana parkeri TaxID=125878 RepID=UPI0008541131|nr:PREDICTED: sphingosine kinase 1 isoform X1 [Nanorana parkeri]
MGDAHGPSIGPADILLCDSFTQVPGEGMVLSLLLTQKELIIQSLVATSSGYPQTSFNLVDCVSCHSFKGKDPKDIGGYFTVVFYPLRGMLGSTNYRQRICRTFRTEVSRDKEQNMKLARTWTEKIKQLSTEPGQPYLVPSAIRVLVLLNPCGGTGKALTLFETHVMPMLTEANAHFTLLVTERPNQAHEVVHDQDLSNWDVIAVMSGDGLIFEVINGLMARQDWADAIKKPLSVLPGGSGNALAASVNYYSGHQQVTGNKLLMNCAFILCKGQPLPLDIVSLTTLPGKRIFSFLSVAWGLISDVDIESEKYRFMGYARFSVGTFVRLTALRTYSGRLSFLPASPAEVEMDNGGSPTADSGVLEDQLLVPLDQPVPSHWNVIEDQFVLVLALYQSHLGAEHFAAPMVKGPGEGLIHLYYATSRISRGSLIKLFMAMEKGTHLDHNIPHFTHLPVMAFRIEPQESTGIMTVDGEVIQCSPIQGQIHRGLGRVISIAQSPNANSNAA